jgi:ribosome-associated protein
LALDKQADNVVLLDARQATFYTDYLVICSGSSDRQVDAIHREILDSLRKESIVLYRSEGSADSGWILLDYLGVVVHIFSTELRDYYGLDSVHEKASKLLTIQ